jgi:glutamate-1-semialdehyde 2,1-aminomutase
MIAVARTLEEGIRARIAQFGLPWHVSRMGARLEYLYRPDVPRNGAEAGAARDDQIELLTHLYFLNRGILMSPFHNMLLASPATSLDDAKRFDAVFAQLLEEFTAP